MSDHENYGFDAVLDGTGERTGSGSRVRIDTRLDRRGCQAVEYDLPMGAHVAEGSWKPCGMPPFAVVYAGHAIDGVDVYPVVCWRHLVGLGDTGPMVVTPWAADTSELAKAADRLLERSDG